MYISPQNLILQGGPSGGEGSQIVMGWANTNNITGQANSTWNLDIDSSNNFRIFSQQANSTTVQIMNANPSTGNVIFAGNVTAQGVGTNLVRRANTIGGSNTVVTLDNLTALVGGSPTRLYIGAATSNMTMAGTSQTMVSGSMAVSSWINLPISTGVGNGFAVGGAISSAGDTVVLNITDQGAGSGTWRVTGMIANTSANLYSVSIERLA